MDILISIFVIAASVLTVIGIAAVTLSKWACEPREDD